MSSIFKGLMEYANISPIVSRSIPKASTITMFLGQVLDVLNHEDLKKAIDDGELELSIESAGAVRFKRLGTDNNKYENNLKRIAFPADNGITRLPLPGELILVVNAQSPSNTPERTMAFYTAVLTGADAIRSTMRPAALTPVDKVESPIAGLLSDITGEVAKKRFEKKLKHLPYTMTKEGRVISNMREGDMVIEGRFGSLIKFTSTIKKEGVWNAKQMTLLDKSNDGDPFIIISNNKHKPPTEPKRDNTKPELIDHEPSLDQSSIYLTTTQNIPIEIKTSRRMAELKSGYVGSGLSPWEYEVKRTITGADGLLLREIDVTQRLQSFFPGEYDPNFIVTATANIPYSPTAYNDSLNAGSFPGGSDPVPITGPASTRQEQLVKQALEASYANGETKHKCARGTFNHANNYMKLYRGEQPVIGMSVSAGGNANGEGFHSHMVQIGYTRFNISNLTKNTLINICKRGPLDANNRHVPWNVGDAITYWSNDGDPGESYRMYGHAQMYTGALTGIGNWVTDNKANYNSFMVYQSKPANSWNAVIFRAPQA